MRSVKLTRKPRKLKLKRELPRESVERLSRGRGEACPTSAIHPAHDAAKRRGRVVNVWASAPARSVEARRV
jgi:hypothetical protein